MDRQRTEALGDGGPEQPHVAPPEPEPEQPVGDPGTTDADVDQPDSAGGGWVPM